MLNTDKSDVLLSGTPQTLKKDAIKSISLINIAGTDLKPQCIKSLGVYVEKDLSFNTHVKSVVKVCNYHMRAFRHVQHYLQDDISATVGSAITTAPIDYSNSLHYDLSSENLCRLERVQRSLARIVAHRPPRSNADVIMHSLYWHPIRARVVFKIALLPYKILKTDTLSYLRDTLTKHQPRRATRSSQRDLLDQPNVRLALCDHAFTNAAPFIWNKLPNNINVAPSVSAFKKQLKTHLFSMSLTDPKLTVYGKSLTRHLL